MGTPAISEPVRAIIAATEVAWAELEAVLHASDHLTLHGDDEHDWSAGDVYAHLGRWLAISAEVIERHLAGERDIHEYDEGERLNLGWIREDHALGTDVARSGAVSAWERLRADIADVEESRWNGFTEAYARGNGVGHVLDHLGYVVAAAGVEAPVSALARLERDRRGWAALVAELDGKPGVALHDPESPDWTSREIFGHFAHWFERGIVVFEAELAGDEAPPLPGGFEELNDRWAAEDRSADVDALRSRALRAFGKRAQLIRSTPADRWSEAMLASVSEDGYDHIAVHSSYIR